MAVAVALSAVALSPSIARAQQPDDSLDLEWDADEDDEPKKPKKKKKPKKFHPVPADAPPIPTGFVTPKEAAQGKRSTGKRPPPPPVPEGGTVVRLGPGAPPVGTATAAAEEEDDGRTALGFAADPPESAETWLDSETEKAIWLSLQRRGAALRANDTANADLETTRILSLKRRLGLDDVPVASAAIAHEARIALQKDNAARAVLLLRQASEISPQMNDLHWMRLEATFRHDRWNASALAKTALAGMAGRFSGFRNQVAVVTDMLAIFGIAFGLLIVVFAVVQAGKYVRYLAHDLIRSLPKFATELQAVVAIIIVWTIPLIFGLGLIVASAIWLACVLGYQKKRERTLGLIALSSLAAFPLVLYLAAPLVLFHGSYTDTLEIAATEAFATDAEAVLQRRVANAPPDFEASMALAHRARVTGRFDEAIRRYDQALAARPGAVAAQNNRGRILYLIGKVDAAQADFRAAATKREAAEPWLNVASVMLDQAKFEQAKAAIEEARSIDSASARAYGNLGADVPTLDKLADVPFDHGALWGRLGDVEDVQRWALAEHVWRTMGSRVPALAMPVIGLVLAMLSMLPVYRRERFKLSSPCPKCGMAAKFEAPESYCDQCQSLFLNKAQIEPATRKRKEASIQMHQVKRRVIRQVLSVVPGAGHLYSGKPVAGSIFALIGFASFVAIVWFSQHSVHSWTIWRAAPIFQNLVLSVVAGFAILLSVKRSWS